MCVVSKRHLGVEGLINGVKSRAPNAIILFREVVAA